MICAPYKDVVNTYAQRIFFQSSCGCIRIPATLVGPKCVRLAAVPHLGGVEQYLVRNILRLCIEIPSQNLKHRIATCRLYELRCVKGLDDPMRLVLIILIVVLRMKMRVIQMDDLVTKKDATKTYTLATEPVGVLDAMEVPVDGPGMEECTQNRIFRQHEKPSTHDPTVKVVGIGKHIDGVLLQSFAILLRPYLL